MRCPRRSKCRCRRALREPAAAAAVSVPVRASPPVLAAGLGERESEQTRAEQHETGCSQDEETVGHQIMITHIAPTTLEPHPNFLKLSESPWERGGRRARSGPRTKTLKCVGKKNTGAKQTQECCNCLDHLKILRAQARTQRHATAHSQKDSGGSTEDPAGVMLWHNSFAGEGNRAHARDFAMGRTAHFA